MTPREKGFLLLSSHLGVAQRKPLTPAQLRKLGERMRWAEFSAEDRRLELRDLKRLGYGTAMAQQILELLEDEPLLERYLHRAKQHGCVPVTRVSPGYPILVRKRLGGDSPGCLWAKGDLSLMNLPGVSLVGSRDLGRHNREFAREVGLQAAQKGLVLISGNARGADRIAQDAALEAGGSVISIVADALTEHTPGDRMLYLSEEDFDEPFSSLRALSRNRCIHTMGQLVFVAQATLGKGGTWDGTRKNLRKGWSNVIVFRDGSDASLELEQMGAYLMDIPDVQDITLATENPYNFLEQTP